ncbi:RNA-directed DNA polymerase, eukaryota [Tanacetum coccineum]
MDMSWMFLSQLRGRKLLHANIARFHRTPLHDKKFQAKNDVGVNRSNTHVFKKDFRVTGVGNSYVHVVKGKPQSVIMESDSSPALVLDDECLNSKDLSNSLLGRVKEFASLSNLKMALTNEGFDDIRIKYMGELWVLLGFASEDSKKLFHDNVGVGSWFSRLKQASMEFNSEGRIVWVEIEGIPFKLWSGIHLNALRLNGGSYYTLMIRKISAFTRKEYASTRSLKRISLRLLKSFFMARFFGFESKKLLDSMMKKLKYLKMKIREWNKGNMKNTKNVKAKHKEDLEALEEIIDKGEGNVEVVNKRMESIEGDENSSFFHGVLNKKRCQLTIRGIMVDGIWTDSPNMVKREFLQHFRKRFDKLDAGRAYIDMSYPKTVSSYQQVELELDVSKEEIKRAVWDCGTDKSSGPDGFTFGFYRRFWKIIENDVFEAVKHFFTYGDIPKGCNSSFIALIPKIPNANLVKDFRPISLIGSLCVATGKDLLIVAVYAPHDFKDKQVLWDYLTHMITNWQGEVVIMSDFNEVRYKSDRFRSVFNVQGANVFNSFIANAGLKEVPVGGSSFTWCHKSATKMSKLDRLLISESLLSVCPNFTAITLA